MISALRRTKILATLGPASDKPEMILKLIQAGADGFRLNFSHGSHEYFRPLISDVRRISHGLNRPVSILQDLQGPKIRVGTLKNHEPVELIPGSKFTITSRMVEGNSEMISTTYENLPVDVRPGERILIDDGLLELKVLMKTDTDVVSEVVVGGLLKEKKGINLPGVRISAPSLTEKDIADAKLGAELGVDYIALSFVRTAGDVVQLRQLLKSLGSDKIRIIAKIEKPEAVSNILEILEASDGVMVARGDLGVEVAAEKVPLLQKMIIERANKEEKLVITATQMLESMVHSVRPTRAEASDVANAILDGTDVVMLSQETAAGMYPEKAVSTMSSIACYTESDEDVYRFDEQFRPGKKANFTQAIVRSAREAAEELKASALVVYTHSGMTARLASCQRPSCPIFAFTSNERTYFQLALVWGVHPYLFEFIPSSEMMIRRGKEILLKSNALNDGDVVVILSGPGPVMGATNMLRIERIGES